MNQDRMSASHSYGHSPCHFARSRADRTTWIKCLLLWGRDYAKRRVAYHGRLSLKVLPGLQLASSARIFCLRLIVRCRRGTFKPRGRRGLSPSKLSHSGRIMRPFVLVCYISPLRYLSFDVYARKPPSSASMTVDETKCDHWDKYTPMSCVAYHFACVRLLSNSTPGVWRYSLPGWVVLYE